MQTKLNSNQLQAFNWITMIIEIDSTTAHFYLQRPKEMKKIFLYKTLCHHYWNKKKQIVCVIFIKITTFFLPNGHTSHSAFRIFIEHDENSIFIIKKNNNRSHYFIQTDLIIWNKIIMQHKHCFEIANKLFKNLRFNFNEFTKSRPLFGEMLIIFGGNFAQILFVVEHGGRFDVVNVCFQKFYIWSQLIILKFTKNMRVNFNNNKFLK